MGYVWSLEGCVESPWGRLAREILTDEWFRADDSGGAKGNGKGEAGGRRGRNLLVLWVDEEAVLRQPLRGIERIVELLAVGGVACPSSTAASKSRLQPDAEKALADRLQKRRMCIKPVKALLEPKGCP